MNFQGVSSTIDVEWMRMVVLGVALVVAFSGVLALGSPPAEAKYKQANCGKFAKKVRQAKTKDQKRSAKYKLKACKNDRKVYNKVKDSRIVGVRSDGEPIDVTLCANGKLVDDIGSDFEEIYGGGWKIEQARVKGKYFEAGFAAKIRGGERVGALKFSKSGWEVGIFSLDQLYNYGAAERGNAKGLCRGL